MTDTITFALTEEGVATITLNRPEVHNAFDDELIRTLLHRLQTIHEDEKIRIVVLAANGKSFSAGADLRWMQRIATYSYEENVQDAQALSALMHTLKFFKKPTIARVQGATFGGGVGLAACCDMVIASTQASFCLSEVKIGLTPAVISPYVITAIGERAARRYFLTAEPISVMEAHRLGLVTQVVEPDQLDATVQNYIQLLLNNGPQALITTKELINRVSVTPYDKAHLQKNVEVIARERISTQGQEGLKAFLEKRKPRWKE